MGLDRLSESGWVGEERGGRGHVGDAVEVLELCVQAEVTVGIVSNERNKMLIKTHCNQLKSV